MKAENMKGALTMEINDLENMNFSFWASEDSDNRHSTTSKTPAHLLEY
jgi:hypothetical protein